jgi:tetratricopeptide (TPR) repeat protein
MRLIHNTISLLGLTSILISPVAASAIQLSQTRSTTTDSYIAQTSANDFVQQGIQKLETGDFRGAIDDFNQALEINPNLAPVYSYRGFARFLLGNPEDALADLTQAIKLDPNNAQAYENRGRIHLEMGNLQQAINDFTQAIEIDPTFVRAYDEQLLTTLRQFKLIQI